MCVSVTKQLSYFTQLQPLSVTLQRNPIFVWRDPALTPRDHMERAMFGLLSSFIVVVNNWFLQFITFFVLFSFAIDR